MIRLGIKTRVKDFVFGDPVQVNLVPFATARACPECAIIVEDKRCPRCTAHTHLITIGFKVPPFDEIRMNVRGIGAFKRRAVPSRIPMDKGKKMAQKG